MGIKIQNFSPKGFLFLMFCDRHGISLEIKRIPRSFNNKADLLRRAIDFDDYTIHDDVFYMLDSKW